MPDLFPIDRLCRADVVVWHLRRRARFSLHARPAASGVGRAAETVATQLTEGGTSRFAQAGAFRLHYHEAGSGPALLLLHGGVAGSCSWNNFKWSLPLLAGNFRVLAVDLPNYGRSDAVTLTEPPSQANARAVKDLMESLGIDKAYLAGNTQAVRDFAVDYPER